MSTAGAGTVGVGAVAVVAAPLLAAAVVGAAAVGTGVLIAKGVMWCGDKIEENYQQTCKEWTNLVESARAENLANVREMSTQLTSQLEYLSASAYEAADNSMPATIDQQALFATIARARVVIDDAQRAAQQGESERNLLAARLRAEIKAGRGILPAELIAEAERALHGTPAIMQAALQKLDAAWNTVNETHARRTRTIRQAQQLLASVSTQLNAIDTMLQEMGSGRGSIHVEQRRQLEKKVLNARDQLEVHPAHALELARAARQEVRPLLESVSAASLALWEETRQQMNTQLGILATLETMVKEAEAITLVDRRTLATLADRVSKTLSEANKMQQSTYTQKQLILLMQRIELLKGDIFREVKKSQQQKVAATIQSTLAELGFLSEHGEQPAIYVNGDVTRVEVMPSAGTGTGERNDRLITFDVSRNGQVNYDFAGYSGSACLKDAQKIFNALQEKGLFILDDHALEKLQRIPAENFSIETLKQKDFQPSLMQNKTQAELAESLKSILEEMGYPQLRQSVVGGFIELEAFNGPIGYSVVLSPEGDVQVFQDANRTDISHNTSDPVVEKMRMLQQEHPEPEVKKSRTPYVQPRPYMKSRKQQMLGH
jgi:hypothetical protein